MSDLLRETAAHEIATATNLSSLRRLADELAAQTSDQDVRAALKSRADLWKVEDMLAAGHYDAALTSIDTELDPSFAHTHYLRGEAMLGMGSWSNARSSFDKAHSMDEGNPLYLSRRLDVPVSSLDAIAIDTELEPFPVHVDEGSLESPRRVAVADSARFQVKVDLDLLDRLLRDRARYRPDASLAAWSRHVRDDLEWHSDGQQTAMLDDFVGIVGMRPPTRRLAGQYARFVAGFDVLGLAAEGLPKVTERDALTAADLGSIMDTNLLRIAASEVPSHEPVQVLEIGGGYGRLAEATLRSWDRPVRFTLTDEIPISLAWAHEYLRRQFPDKSISMASGDTRDEVLDIAIVPGWERDLLPADHFDIAINIESFQEMPQSEVESWITTMDRCVKLGGFILISNSRAYVNRESWPIPSDWNVVAAGETPRSWTVDHPTVLYRKGADPMWGSSLRRALTNMWKAES